ncbi:hypothetical protein BESB_033610 [Besnoitia besnoiti]|uniref:Uncharacterized protein n=1 Tax=Besnoitia besnoiti TaxID=94643 RepID=A0A2A9MM99_BESBE|nr:hypothetical protein BESB_033610 [Besnoitia besnoiti]PFH36903.1 hypothetical protein BESB_033610 [Besnoitia besnoiti]
MAAAGARRKEPTSSRRGGSARPQEEEGDRALGFLSVFAVMAARAELAPAAAVEGWDGDFCAMKKSASSVDPAQTHVPHHSRSTSSPIPGSTCSDSPLPPLPAALPAYARAASGGQTVAGSLRPASCDAPAHASPALPLAEASLPCEAGRVSPPSTSLKNASARLSAALPSVTHGDPWRTEEGWRAPEAAGGPPERCGRARDRTGLGAQTRVCSCPRFRVGGAAADLRPRVGAHRSSSCVGLPPRCAPLTPASSSFPSPPVAPPPDASLSTTSASSPTSSSGSPRASTFSTASQVGGHEEGGPYILYLEPSPASSLHRLLNDHARMIAEVWGPDPALCYPPHCSLSGFFKCADIEAVKASLVALFHAEGDAQAPASPRADARTAETGTREERGERRAGAERRGNEKRESAGGESEEGVLLGTGAREGEEAEGGASRPPSRAFRVADPEAVPPGCTGGGEREIGSPCGTAEKNNAESEEKPPKEGDHHAQATVFHRRVRAERSLHLVRSSTPLIPSVCTPHMKLPGVLTPAESDTAACSPAADGRREGVCVGRGLAHPPSLPSFCSFSSSTPSCTTPSSSAPPPSSSSASLFAPSSPASCGSCSSPARRQSAEAISRSFAAASLSRPCTLVTQVSGGPTARGAEEDVACGEAKSDNPSAGAPQPHETGTLGQGGTGGRESSRLRAGGGSAPPAEGEREETQGSEALTEEESIIMSTDDGYVVLCLSSACLGQSLMRLKRQLRDTAKVQFRLKAGDHITLASHRTEPRTLEAIKRFYQKVFHGRRELLLQSTWDIVLFQLEKKASDYRTEGRHRFAEILRFPAFLRVCPTSPCSAPSASPPSADCAPAYS